MKTKVLISCAVTAQLICVFVFAYAKSRFSHDAAHIMLCNFRQYHQNEAYVALFSIEVHLGTIPGEMFLKEISRPAKVNVARDTLKDGFSGQIIEPRYEKTGFLHMRKQSRRSAVR